MVGRKPSLALTLPRQTSAGECVRSAFWGSLWKDPGLIPHEGGSGPFHGAEKICSVLVIAGSVPPHHITVFRLKLCFLRMLVSVRNLSSWNLLDFPAVRGLWRKIQTPDVPLVPTATLPSSLTLPSGLASPCGGARGQRQSHGLPSLPSL